MGVEEAGVGIDQGDDGFDEYAGGLAAAAVLLLGSSSYAWVSMTGTACKLQLLATEA